MGSCAAIRARPQCGVEVSGHVTENFGNLGNSADIVVFTCPNDISNNLERFHVQVLFRLGNVPKTVEGWDGGSCIG